MDKKFQHYKGFALLDGKTARQLAARRVMLRSFDVASLAIGGFLALSGFSPAGAQVVHHLLPVKTEMASLFVMCAASVTSVGATFGVHHAFSKAIRTINGRYAIDAAGRAKIKERKAELTEMRAERLANQGRPKEPNPMSQLSYWTDLLNAKRAVLVKAVGTRRWNSGKKVPTKTAAQVVALAAAQRGPRARKMDPAKVVYRECRTMLRLMDHKRHPSWG